MSGLSLTTGKRNIKDGSRFNSMFPSEQNAYGNNSVLKRNGNVYDTVKLMGEIIERDKGDTEKIAQYLKGSSREETLKNIHDFMITYLQYDTEEGEKLRSPRRTWWVGQTQNDKDTGDSGVDCDDLAIFSGSILRNLGIPFFIRIVKVNGNKFQHVYLVVPTQGEELSGTYITLDGVISDFNYEYPFKQEKTFNNKGMKIQYLGNLPMEYSQTSKDPLLKLLIDFYNEISFGNVSPLKIQREDVLMMLSYAIANWDDPKTRAEALRILSKSEKLSYPGQTFFTGLLKIVRKNPTLSGLSGDDYFIGPPPPPDYGNTTTTDGGNGNGAAWAGAITAAFSALANFDWGLVGGSSNQQSVQPPVQYQPPTNKAQIAGMSIGTIGGIFLMGGMGYLLYTNLSGKKSIPPRVAKITKKTTNK